jgi:hypothetical protein
MRNIQKCINTYNIKVESDLKIIVNGHYENTECQDDLDVIRFMIGGIDSK